MAHADRAALDLRALRRELGLPVRLLLIGLPLTVVLGAVVAWGLFPELGLAGAALLAAILAPTDAALGQAVVSNERIPLRIRQALNVESGLNDGLALPLVLALAAAAALQGQDGELTSWLGFAALQITVGPATGVAVSELVTDGEATTVDVTPFRHARFGEEVEVEANVF